jgi:hypothetical protein
MASTVPKAFAEFADIIKPTAKQEATITARRDAVRGFMLAKYGPSSNMPLLETKVIGSAARKTLIRPVDDIDIFCVFDSQQVWSRYNHDSKQLLYRVREALDGYSVKTMGSRGQAVRLFYNDGLNVDITPAFGRVDLLGRLAGYVIPRGDGGWQETNPYRHGGFMAKRNEELGDHLKPLVRLLKRWNRAHSARLASFHLELIIQDTFRTLGGNMRAATRVFFENASGHLHVEDPAGYSRDLASRMTASQLNAVVQSFTAGADRARRAQEAEAAGKVKDALRQWRIVFGDEFPSHG